MTTALIKRCDLLGKSVIDQNTAEEIGTIAQLFIDVKTHRIMQIECKSGFLVRTGRCFKWDDIDSIDTDTVFINGAGIAAYNLSASAQAMVGLEVWSDGENKAGVVSDYCIDLETGSITDYVFVFGGVATLPMAAHRLPPTAIISVSRQRITVMHEVLQSAEYFSTDFQDRLTQALEFIKQGCAQSQLDVVVSAPVCMVREPV